MINLEELIEQKNKLERQIKEAKEANHIELASSYLGKFYSDGYTHHRVVKVKEDGTLRSQSIHNDSQIVADSYDWFYADDIHIEEITEEEFEAYKRKACERIMRM